MKILMRIIFLNIVTAQIIALVYPITFSKSIDQMSDIDWLILGWIAISIIGCVFWLVMLFYNWGTVEFISSNGKSVWFLVLLIGMIFYLTGPLVYYVLVYELKKGVKVGTK